MGLVAFVCLMSAELALDYFLVGSDFVDHFEKYKELPSLLGLLGQSVFALMPFLIQSNQLETIVNQKIK